MATVVVASSCLIRLIQRDHPEAFTDPIQVASLLLSALVHDTDHPGVMNPYLIATRHPIAMQLGEAPKAVLEHHHAAMALLLLERPELNFLDRMADNQRGHFLELIRENVLSTDVTTTMAAAKALQAKSRTGRPRTPSAEEMNQRLRKGSVTTMQFEELARRSSSSTAGGSSSAGIDAGSAGPTPPGPSPLQVMCLIIKAADISNPARSLHVYKQWIGCVMTEFWAQGDAERAAGFSISMNCDRHNASISRCQVGFIDFLVA
jgi:cAMP-specific phosphodiesterase 4